MKAAAYAAHRHSTKVLVLDDIVLDWQEHLRETRESGQRGVIAKKDWLGLQYIQLGRLECSESSTPRLFGNGDAISLPSWHDESLMPWRAEPTPSLGAPPSSPHVGSLAMEKAA